MNKEYDKTMTGFASIDKPWLKYYSEEVKNKNMPKMNVNDYLYENNIKHLGRTALNYFGHKISYEDLFNKIEKTAKSFVDMGMKKGDIVTVSLPMVPESIYIFYALAKIGAISNMIDPRTNENGTREYLKEVDSTVLVIFDDMYTNVKNIINEDLLKKLLLLIQQILYHWVFVQHLF